MVNRVAQKKPKRFFVFIFVFGFWFLLGQTKHNQGEREKPTSPYQFGFFFF